MNQIDSSVAQISNLLYRRFPTGLAQSSLPFVTILPPTQTLPIHRQSKIRNRKFHNAFTLTELMVVVVVVALLAGLVLIALAKAKPKSGRASCQNNLKQIGLAYRTWEGDYGDKYPQVLAGGTNLFANGISMLTDAWAPTTPASGATLTSGSQPWMVYAVMQNELNNPRIITCPADTRAYATNWSNLGNSNISYFVGIDADETLPHAILSGDRNLVTNGVDAPTGLASIRTTDKLSWSSKIHNRAGNILLSDGSVQQTDSKTLQKIFQDAGTNLTRLTVP